MSNRLDDLETRVAAIEGQQERQRRAIDSWTDLHLELANEARLQQTRHDEVLRRIDGHDRTLADVLGRLGTRGLVAALVAFLLHLASTNLWRFQRPAAPVSHPRTEAPAP